MASLATFVNRFMGAAALAEPAPAVWARTESPRLRPIANEDVYLFVKRIDNTGVVRAADPAARKVRTRSVATGFIAASLIIASLAPAAYNTMAGFTLQRLRQDQEHLKQQLAVLNTQEAELLSPSQLDKIAKKLKLVNPAPQDIQYLDSKAKNADARNILPVTASLVAR